MTNQTLCISKCHVEEGCAPTFKGAFRAQVQRWQRRLLRWQINWRTRRQLRNLIEMDGYLLKDIGVSRGEAEQEVAKPFWRD